MLAEYVTEMHQTIGAQLHQLWNPSAQPVLMKDDAAISEALTALASRGDRPIVLSGEADISKPPASKQKSTVFMAKTEKKISLKDYKELKEKQKDPKTAPQDKLAKHQGAESKSHKIEQGEPTAAVWGDYEYEYCYFVNGWEHNSNFASPYKLYFAEQARLEANPAWSLDLFNHIYDQPLSNLRDEYQRLKDAGYPQYTGDAFYPDLAEQEMTAKGTYSAQEIADIKAYIEAQPIAKRGKMYSVLKLIKWALPVQTNSTFWTKHIPSDDSYYCQKVQYLLQFDWEDQPYEFWRIYQRSWWTDRMTSEYQYQIYWAIGSRESEPYENRIMSQPLTKRGEEFEKIQDEGVALKYCSYDSNYFYSFYDYDYYYYEEPMQPVEDWFTEYLVNLPVTILWSIFYFGGISLITMASGPLLFPVFLLCLVFSDGNLETCSLGIWDNSYKDYYSDTYYYDDMDYCGTYEAWYYPKPVEPSDLIYDQPCTLI